MAKMTTAIETAATSETSGHRTSYNHRTSYQHYHHDGRRTRTTRTSTTSTTNMTTNMRKHRNDTAATAATAAKLAFIAGVVFLVLTMMKSTTLLSTTGGDGSTTMMTMTMMFGQQVDASAIVPYRPNKSSHSRLLLAKQQSPTTKTMKSFFPGRGRRRQSFIDYGDTDDDDDDEDDDEDDYDIDYDRRQRQRASVARREKSASVDWGKRNEDTTGGEMESDETTEHVGLFQTVVAGVVEIAFSAIYSYCSSFVSVYFIGTIVGTPGFLFRPMNPNIPYRQTRFLPELKGRIGRMNQRSFKWAKSWAKISTIFDVSEVSVRVVRNGHQDVWNEIISSAIAGAAFAWKDGPNAMVRSAVTYGTLIYFISQITSKQRGTSPDDYTESPLASSTILDHDDDQRLPKRQKLWCRVTEEQQQQQQQQSHQYNSSIRPSMPKQTFAYEHV